MIDSPQSLITAQVESGLVVRMAILYELLAGSDRAGPSAGRRPPTRRRSGSRRERCGDGSASRLGCRGRGRGADLVLRGARLLDPRAGLDAARDLVVRDGEIAEIAEPGSAPEIEGAEVVDGEGLLALPAFVDPHVHLRVPGPGAQGGPRDGHPRRRGRRLLRA